jgi:putative transposase
MAGEGLPVPVAARMLGVWESGYYASLIRPPSTRAIRHVWLTNQIREVHVASTGIYGGQRVHAELTFGRGVTVSHGTVELLMSRAGIRGMAGRPRWRRPRPALVAGDLVERDFGRSGPNQLWVTDYHRAPDQEGQGVLRGGAGRLLPSGRRLVDRCLPDGSASDQCAGHGDRVPHPAGGRGDPLRPGREIWLLGLHWNGQSFGLVPSMGSIADCYDCETPACRPAA